MKTVDEFFKNYGMLHDAVIKSISLSYNTEPCNTQICMNVECMSVLKGDKWISLSMVFYDVEEFKISSNYYYGINSIENFCVSFQDNSTVFDFIPNIVCPSNIEEHRKSLFYFVFKDIDFQESELD